MRKFRLALLALALCCACAPKSDWIGYVDPMVGTIRPGETMPAVEMPYGMNSWTPETMPDESKGHCPYYHVHDRLYGIRASHWMSGSATQDYGSFTLMPLMDSIPGDKAGRSATFRHDNEIARPDYYSVVLDNGIRIEVTGTSRAGILRVTWPGTGKAYLVLSPNSDEGVGAVRIDPKTFEVTAENPVHRIYQGWGEEAGFSGHCTLVTRQKPVDCGVCARDQLRPGDTNAAGYPHLAAYLELDVQAGETTEIKLATSWCDVDGARANLRAEIPGWDFAAVQRRLTKAWEKQLSTIEVSTPDTTALRKFYTAFYHASFLPRTFSDADGRYPSFAGGRTIARTDGVYYDDFSLWDTYRALHPLLTLLWPEMTGDMMQSLVLKYEQGGWMPIFPCWNSYTSEMVGDHAASVIADAWLKGVRNFDVEKAWEGLRQNAFELPTSYQEYCDGKGRRALTDYMRLGYIPNENPVQEAFHKREQVSRTLEYAYDDYALSLLAAALGHEEDAAVLRERSGNWRNVFDPRTGWVQGRYRDGSFRDDDNAFQNKSFITEGRPCHYSFYVPQDPQGLIEVMGGREAFLAKMDTVFTGGWYWHGNEPGHQIPFMYSYAGAPQQTQATVRHILDTEYNDGPDGLSGNDDTGQMSAWYMFAALGFYPVCPVSGEYILASPTFERAVIHLPGGKQFTIVTKNGGPRSAYVKSVTLNGNPHDGIALRYEDLRRGGEMVFEMAPTP
ncbi:MAG: GH92 family glycosyl hydrolase [Bacteroidales bacterium]|nr:GH92 family glycosyl hydrolase [Bacteroidales bacterium]